MTEKYLLTFDPSVGAAYLYASTTETRAGKKGVRTIELENGLYVDREEYGKILGVEILNMSSVTLADVVRALRDDSLAPAPDDDDHSC